MNTYDIFILISSFLVLIEAGLLLFCCRIGQKYTGHLFVFGLVVLLFSWINFYLMFIFGVQIIFAAIVGEVVNVLVRKWHQRQR